MTPGCMRRIRACVRSVSRQGGRHAAACLAMAVLYGWTLVGAGIIELGRKASQR